MKRGRICERRLTSSPVRSLALPRGVLAGWALLLGIAPAAAGDLNGSAQVSTGGTSSGGSRTDILEQQYTLGFLQPLTPYLSLRLGYQYYDFGSTFEDGTSFDRRTRQPLVELLYNRDRLSSRVAFYKLTADGTSAAETFDQRSLAANLNWKPARGPGFTVNFRDDRNVADVSVFGKDVGTRLLDLTAFYNRRHWSASYTFETLSIDNASNAFSTDQKQHEVRASAQRSFWGDRFSVGLSGRASLLDRTTATGADSVLAEPIPAAAGLFAVDATPEIGELTTAPTLVDGNATTPASPDIEIGGASTFRNVGIDLGVTRPVTRLEITVDTVSGASVAWQVYHSRDNLFWEAVPGVTSTFDAGLLRYGLRFPETEDRFFKAVNVSVNPAPTVRVTEVRALLDLPVTATREASDDNRYRGDVVVGFRPARRLSGSFGFGASNDETITAGLLRRDYRETHALAQVTLGLARSLDLNLGYRYNDSADRREPVLLRTVNQLNASLTWRPLPTLDTALTLGQRNESEKSTLLQSQRSIRLAAALQLLADLRYVTDLDVARIEDPFAGRDRNSWTWSHNLELRPVPAWIVNGGLTYSQTETPGGEALLDRTQYRFWTTWTPTSYLVLGGTWWYTDDSGQTSLNQSYNLSYAPGDRLTLSATYQGYEAFGGYETSTDSLDATYRLFTRLVLFANLSRSMTMGGGVERLRVSNFRAGLQLAF
jgi:hypothetical protein